MVTRHERRVLRSRRTFHCPGSHWFAGMDAGENDDGRPAFAAAAAAFGFETQLLYVSLA